jgi:large-conductance mechanosensitive channel
MSETIDLIVVILIIASFSSVIFVITNNILIAIHIRVINMAGQSCSKLTTLMAHKSCKLNYECILIQYINEYEI